MKKMEILVHVVALVGILVTSIYILKDLTPSERHHCMVTMTDKSICQK